MRIEEAEGVGAKLSNTRKKGVDFRVGTFSGVYVPISAVFPQTLPDLPTLLRLLGRLSLTDVMFWCARINHVLTNASDLTHVQKQDFGVRQFLTSAEIELVNGFAKEHHGPMTVFFRGALLEIIRWTVLVCGDHPRDGSTFEDGEVRRTFAKVALIASDIWGSRVYGEAFNLDSRIIAARSRSIGPFRKAVEGAQVAPSLAHALGRGWEIFSRLLPSIEPTFRDRFKAAVGLSIEEYYACCCALITQFMKPGSEATIFDADTLGGGTTNPALVQRFVALESQTLPDLRQALWGEDKVENILARSIPVYEYKPFREKPLIRAADGRAIIIDPVFMSDKLAVGPLFHALKSCCSREEVTQLFSGFGYAFERYVEGILRRSFPKPATPLFDPLSCSLSGRSDKGQHFEIDACLNYITELILFEVKSTWSREGEFAPENSASLLQSLYRQYGLSSDGGKGAAQLARIVNLIAGREWLGPQGEFEQVKRILPVLVVHDVLLGAPGFGHFIAAAFDEALGPHERPTLNERLKEPIRVAAPIVIGVEDLELLEVSIEHFGFREVLADYSEACPDRMTAFYEFLASSPKYSCQIYPNRHLASTAMKPLEIAMERLFSTVPERTN
jgi:hypothetical protein